MTNHAADLLQQEFDRLANEWRAEAADLYRRETLGVLIKAARRVDEILLTALRQMNEG